MNYQSNAVFIWRYLRVYRTRLVAMMSMLVMAAAATLVLPFVFRSLVDVSELAHAQQTLSYTFVILLGVILLLAVASAGRYYAVSWIAEKIVIDVRHDLFKHMVKLDRGVMNRFSHSQWVSTMHTDTTLIEGLIVSCLSQAVRNVIIAIGAWIMLWATSWVMAAAVIVLLTVLLSPLMLFIRRYRALSRESQNQVAEDQGFVQRILAGLHHFQIYNQTTHLAHLFDQQLQKTSQTSLARIQMRAWLTFFFMAAVLVGLAGIVYVSFYLTLTQGMSLSSGQLSQFFLYALVFGGSMASLSEVGSELARASGALDRLRELMMLRPELSFGTELLTGTQLQTIQMHDLTFSYQSDQYIFKDVQLSCKPGLISLIGSSGCGKSTLIGLLLRQLKASSGSLLVNEKSIFEYDSQDFYQHCAWCAESDVILPLSIRENVMLGCPNASEDRLLAVLDATAVSDFAQHMPHGIETKLQEFGKNISQGMRQRVLLARALLKRAAITVLDEATNALDSPTERRILTYLKENFSDRFVFFVGHRLNHIHYANMLVVLSAGKVHSYDSVEAFKKHSESVYLIDK